MQFCSAVQIYHFLYATGGGYLLNGNALSCTLFYDAHMWFGISFVIMWLKGKHMIITLELPCLFLLILNGSK